MKKNRLAIFTLVIIIAVITIFSTKNVMAKDEKKVKAAWISTVYNLDYPKTKGIENQKAEFIKVLDNLEKAGINKIVLQVRPKSDALYKSKINPWSDVLTGEQGKDPGYDPLEFMIKETHKRGMTFHAWLNPYRITTVGDDLNVLSKDHLAYNHPEYTIIHDAPGGKKAICYNPELEEVKVHIEETVEEIINNYDVDGIHFDDYFYPSNFPLPEGESLDGQIANKRREDVNDMVKRVSNVIKKGGKEIKFGISPMGIWKNNSSDKTGSNTNGMQSYYHVYADTRTWIKNGWIDYVVPQIYWETGHKLADYEELVRWWNKEVNNTGVELYIGHGIYKEQVAREIDKQINILDKYKNVKGSYFFSMRDITENKMGVRDKLINLDNKVEKNPFTNPFKRIGISSDYKR